MTDGLNLQPPTQDEFAREARFAEQGERFAAGLKARDLLHGMEYDSEDVLVVADWLLTGTADVAVRMSQQRADNYVRSREIDVVENSPDAAHWSSHDVSDDARDDARLGSWGALPPAWPPSPGPYHNHLGPDPYGGPMGPG